MTNSSFPKSLSLCIAYLFVAGCGADLGPAHDVSGKVTSGSKPLSNATVSFAAVEGLPAEYRFKTATTGSDGSFVMEDVYEAEYTVTIVPAKAAIDPEVDPGEATADPEGAERKNELQESGPLRAKVAADSTTFEFNLPP